MADIVWSVLVGLPDATPRQIAALVDMTRLWAGHLRGPGEHDGPIRLLTNLDDLSVEGVSIVEVRNRARDRRQVFRHRPPLAYRHLRPESGDRCMQLDLDSLARHPIAPLFDDITPGEMRVAPSGLPLTHWQQMGSLLNRWRRAWYGHVYGWHERLGVSASLTACTGTDWPDFMGRWVAAIERHAERSEPSERPGDQGYLNYLYTMDGIPMRRYGPRDIHHLRVPETASREDIDRARVLHFPVPEKLQRMREWSRL
ncbi:MAG: hypothetical protein ACR2GQ_06010 [Gemmatimonadota bacterium]